MQLKDIYQPIRKELKDVEELLRASLTNTGYKSISEVNNYLLDAKGKRLRPALVIFSAKAAKETRHLNKHSMASLACAVELIHIASLIHDDVMDHAALRHHKPTINSKYGEDVSITLGDYLYSKAFELISNCRDIDILSCISQATRLMCEGQLIQVCERDNLELLKNKYIIVVKKKTAALFAASCRAGAVLADAKVPYKNILGEYGLNFGIAFQIIDDCLDLIAKEEDIGKDPGADLKMGELTLPVLNLLSKSKDKNRILSLMKEKDNGEAFRELRERFINSEAALATKKDILFYVRKAKKSLGRLEESCFKEGMCALADFMVERLKLSVSVPPSAGLRRMSLDGHDIGVPKR